MAGEFEERQEIPAPQQEPRAAVVETPSPVVMSAEPATMMAPAAADTAEGGDDQYFSQADALRKNPQFQTRTYGMDDSGPQAKNEARNDNGLSGHGEPKKLRADEIALGGSQNSGAQMIRANLMTSHKDTQASAIQAQQDRARATEMRIAQWNASMTMVGGVQMTNEQAQNARREVVENGDQYANWAVKKGLIKEEDKEKFKKTAKEMYDLKEAEKLQGKMTTEQQKRFDELQNSVSGRAVDKAAAANHTDKALIDEKTITNISTASEETRTNFRSQLAAIDKDSSQDAAISQAVQDAYLGNKAQATNTPANKNTAEVSIASRVSASSMGQEFDLNADFNKASTNAVAAATPQIAANLENKPKPIELGRG